MYRSSYLKSGFIKAVQFVFSEGSDVIVIFFEGASQYIDGFLGVLEGVTTFMNHLFISLIMSILMMKAGKRLQMYGLMR